ncbi:PAS domain-containing protein [uncultured Methanoregula sp.]|uniref:PAS domain-containing protein n=1 Tax=uncultured Methanoregula sp. TaxID=1005933 RepID=UPI002AAAC120|nr:PAS domain-containing protein [uncultured Methanoregula sp.]
MKTISPQKTLGLSIIALLTIGIVLLSIFSLKNGYLNIFPYFYILPILILAYFHPRYAVYFTVFLGWIFLGLVCLYGPPDIQLYASSVAFFYIFVSLGVIISAYSGQLLQERRYREIFESSQAGILTFDVETQKIREINIQAATILGSDPEALKKQPFSAFMLDTEQELRVMKSIRRDEKITDMEIALQRKDRSVIWVIITASLTKDGTVVCSLVDITESRRTKDELIESELRYRTLFDGASDAIFLHDIDGRIYETNVIATRYLGFSKKELMKLRLHDLDVDPEHLFTPDIIRTFQARGHILFETVMKKKDGSTLPVEISSRITEYFGMPAVMSTVRDISERREK